MSQPPTAWLRLNAPAGLHGAALDAWVSAVADPGSGLRATFEAGRAWQREVAYGLHTRACPSTDADELLSPTRFVGPADIPDDVA